MSKKLITILMVLCLLFVSFTGCKKDDSKSSSSPKTSTGTKSSASPSKAAQGTSTAATASSTASGTPTATTVADNGPVTDYQIDLDFQVKSQVAGVVFGYVDNTTFLMWQVNVWDFGDNPVKEIPQADWKVYFRPHVWNAGTVTVIEEKDISNAIKFEDRFKKHHMKITVNAANEINTYINDVLVYTYTDPIAAYGMFGFRETGNQCDEQSYFDNIVIKNTKTNKILFQEDFNKSNPFPQGEIVSGVMGDSPAVLMAVLEGELCILEQ